LSAAPIWPDLLKPAGRVLDLTAAVERVHAAVPGFQLRLLEGQTHNLAAEPAAAMAKEFFLGR
jgi:hypothetical protein